MASIILFLPTSFIIGVSSPYLARLRNRSVDTTGRSVALLDASNSFGGIAGTFITGFTLIGLVGLRVSLLLLIMMLIILSWTLTPRQSATNRLWLTAIALVLGLAPQTLLDRSVRAEIDTPTAHYQIRDVQYGGQPVTAISTGPGGLQSGVYQNGSKELVFSYTRQIADVIRAAPTKQNILIIGGGAFTVPEHVARQYPDSRVDTVEIDPELPRIAAQYFNFSKSDNLSIIAQDARAYLATTTTQYDIIVLDAYNDASIPFSLVTAEFTRSLKAATKPGGTVIANIITGTAPNCKPLFNAFGAIYDIQYKNARYYPLVDPSFATRQNIIAVYSDSTLQWTPAGNYEPQLDAVPLPTDDKAPIERLTERCITN